MDIVITVEKVILILVVIIGGGITFFVEYWINWRGKID